MSSDDVDDSRIVEDVTKITSVVEDTLVDSSTLILHQVYISSEGTGDVDPLMESSTPILMYIYVHEDDTSDFEHLLVKFSMPIQIASYSLATPMIEDVIEHEIVATIVVTSSKLLQSPRTIVRFTNTSLMRRRNQFIF